MPMDKGSHNKEIKLFDQYGRSYNVELKNWKQNILPNAIKESWEDPNSLGQIIIQAIKQGAYKDVELASKRLIEIDTNKERAISLRCLVLTELKDIKEAKYLLNKYIKENPPSAPILLSLAKIYTSEGDLHLAFKYCEEALLIDPNDEGALQLYWQFRVLEGRQALVDVSRLPNSWRSKCYLAKLELERDNTEGALNFYKLAFEDSKEPYPEELLTMVSGELGNAGLLIEALNLSLDKFDPKEHELAIANNIIKLLIDLGQPAEAKELIKKLWLRDRPDWKEALLFWESEAVNLDLETRDNIQSPEIVLSTIQAPIWRKSVKGEKKIQDNEDEDEEQEKIAFLTSSATIPEEARKWGISGACGRYSRALPCYWAEQISLKSNAKTFSMQVSLDDGTAILMGSEAEDEHYCIYARNNKPVVDYIVVSHITPTFKSQAGTDKDWNIKARLLRTIDGVCLESLSTNFNPVSPKEGIEKLTKNLIQAVLTHTDTQPIKQDQSSISPEPFEGYLLRLEQLQSLFLHFSMKNKGKEFNGLHEFITGSIELCLNNPKNSVARLILAQCFWVAKRIEAKIDKQYRKKIECLNSEYPLSPEQTKNVLSILNRKP